MKNNMTELTKEEMMSTYGGGNWFTDTMTGAWELTKDVGSSVWNAGRKVGDTIYDAFYEC